MPATITNAERLLRKMTRIPDAMRAEIKKSLAESAQEVVDMMRRLVPVESGDLRDSIGWRWGRTAPTGAMAVASAGSGDLTLTIYAGSAKAYYSRWVEFGTVKMAARPYFFVSWRAARKGVRKRNRAAVRAAARKVAGSG